MDKRQGDHLYSLRATRQKPSPARESDFYALTDADITRSGGAFPICVAEIWRSIGSQDREGGPAPGQSRNKGVWDRERRSRL